MMLAAAKIRYCLISMTSMQHSLGIWPSIYTCSFPLDTVIITLTKSWSQCRVLGVQSATADSLPNRSPGSPQQIYDRLKPLESRNPTTKWKLAIFFGNPAELRVIKDGESKRILKGRELNDGKQRRLRKHCHLAQCTTVELGKNCYLNRKKLRYGSSRKPLYKPPKARS